jgi:hypothetical protein
MTSTLNLTAAHRPSLFAGLFAKIVETFAVLHTVQWRAPWNERDQRWATRR